jgi:hypothetical protein
MSTFVGNTSDGFPIYSDSNGCYITGNDGFDYPVSCPAGAGGTVPPLQIPTYPSGGGGGYIQPGGSWLNDTLNTILGLSAIANRGSIGAQGVNQQQQVNPYSLYAYQNQQLGQGIGGGIGTQAGASIGTFFQQNAFYLIIGLGIFMLYKSGRK